MNPRSLHHRLRPPRIPEAIGPELTHHHYLHRHPRAHRALGHPRGRRPTHPGGCLLPLTPKHRHLGRLVGLPLGSGSHYRAPITQCLHLCGLGHIIVQLKLSHYHHVLNLR